MHVHRKLTLKDNSSINFHKQDVYATYIYIYINKYDNKLVMYSNICRIIIRMMIIIKELHKINKSCRCFNNKMNR